MSGKSYTMKEMKAIVEYLTEHGAYSEIKGRKMWMDLASSKITNRTWQSLKETFLKRILPDIHNPYYKLSVTQISSFQQGQDIEKRLNNRLEIRSTNQNSDSEGLKEKDTKTPGSNNGMNEDAAGEDPKLLNLRASTETLVLEDCYETAEEIKKDLLSSDDNVQKTNKESQPTKSLRELITYSDPLTPMLQSVIDDFATDDEERESGMQIVEPEEISDKTEKDNEKTANNDTIEISDSEGNDIQGDAAHNLANKPDIAVPLSPHEDQQELVTSGSKKIEAINDNSTTLISKNSSKDSSAVNIVEDNNPKKSLETTQNNSANITDTLLPGNQEAFNDNIKNKSDKHNEPLNKKLTLRNSQKRASSQDPEPKKKKRLLSKVKSISDTEKFNSTSRKVIKESKLSFNKESSEGNAETSLNMDSEKCDSQPIQEMEVTENIQNAVTQNTAQIQNPCLNNVNLYAEQFSTEKYVDSDDNKKKDSKMDTGQRFHKDHETSNAHDVNKTQIDKEPQLIKNNNNETTNLQNINESPIDKTDKTKKTVNKKPANKKKDTNNENMDKDRIDDEINIIDNNDKTNDKTDDSDKYKKRMDENYKTNNKNTTEHNKEKSAAIQTCDQDNEDVITLKSHSDSVSEGGCDALIRGQKRLVKQQRDRSLANMFGFSSGGTIRRQRRSTNRRKHNKSHSRSRTFKVSSASSDWTSDTSSEYVSSPPRQRGPKGRYTRKYLKPKSAPIMSLEEEGGLFVMYGKKIYPIVKDGKTVKNYVTYTAEDDEDQEESFWKLKYVEEKKKTAELTKLLNEAKDKRRDPSLGEPSRVPSVLPSTTQKNDDCITISDDTVQPEVVKPVPAEPAAKTVPVKIVPEPKPTCEEKKTVKIKFIKKDEEVQLEGHWSQLSPVLAHVAQLFQKEPASRSSSSSKTDLLLIEPTVPSGKSTPIEEVVAKVNQRENEIAKEIERYYKEEITAPEKPPQTQNNVGKRVANIVTDTENVKVGDAVLHHEDTPAPEESTLAQNITKRKGRPRKVSPGVSPSPAKKPKVDVVTQNNATAQTIEQTPAEKYIIEGRTRRTKTPKSLYSDTDQTNRTYTVRTRKSTPRSSLQKAIDTKETDVVNEDEDILYKFPPQSVSNRKSYASKGKVKALRNVDKLTSKRLTNLSLAENLTNSVETMDEYQHNDINTSGICIKNNGKIGLTCESERHYAKHLQDMINLNMTDDLSESSISFQNDHIESMTFQNSTISSEIYQTDSYRMLMNKEPLNTKNSSKLEKINEISFVLNDFDTDENAFNEISNKNDIDPNNKENLKDILQINIYNDNSSNVSLPTSPVLSIVENISISKTLLSSMDMEDYSVGDKPGDVDVIEQTVLNELMTPNADVTMPLMEKECGIEKSNDNGKEYHYNLRDFKTASTVSDSLLDKINTVNINDQTISESLNVKLKNLLLQSTKKLKRVNIETENVEVIDKSGPKKAKSKKRSSTPRKRSARIISNTDPHVMAEHTETCSLRGRESCPPVILVSQQENNGIMTPPVTESALHLTVKPTSTKRNKKKDIIKVKIGKPKTKGKANSCDENVKASFIDSGINDSLSEIKFQHSDESIEYIHNHSDTCLNAHECMDDSVQIVDNTANSIISLETNSAFSDLVCRVTGENVMQDLYNEVQDRSDAMKDFQFPKTKQLNSETTTVYHTPLGSQSPPNSIMTDDLSFETNEEPVQNSKWYLLSEQESSSSNCFNVNENSETMGCSNFSRLEQIFPVTCAVPDLSTITENSSDTGDAKNIAKLTQKTF